MTTACELNNDGTCRIAKGMRKRWKKEIEKDRSRTRESGLKLLTLMIELLAHEDEWPVNCGLSRMSRDSPSAIFLFFPCPSFPYSQILALSRFLHLCRSSV